MPLYEDPGDRHWDNRGLILGDQFRVVGGLDGDARGNWAKVVEAESLFPDATGGQRRVALKIMRDRHLADAEVYKMYGREARILDRYANEVAATTLLASGYVQQARTGNAVPLEISEGVEDFTSQLPSRQQDGWKPLLVLQLSPFRRTLLHRLRQLYSSQTPYLNGMIPLWEAITITARGLSVLEKCHKQQLYYIDHKPEHVVWHDSRVRFIDWNASEWVQDERRGSVPHGLVQQDLMNYTGYVVFPLFTGLQIDGNPVRSIQRGTPHPPPVQLANGELLDFFEANDWLGPELRAVLSRPFWSPGERYNSAMSMHDDLLNYLERWKVGGLYDRLVTVVNEIEAAEESLQRAQDKLRILHRLTEQPSTAQLPITHEVRRIEKHLRQFGDRQMLITSD